MEKIVDIFWGQYFSGKKTFCDPAHLQKKNRVGKKSDLHETRVTVEKGFQKYTWGKKSSNVRTLFNFMIINFLKIAKKIVDIF